MSKVIYILVCLLIILGVLFATLKTEGFNDTADSDRIIGFILLGLGVVTFPYGIGILIAALGVYFLKRSGF
jgi:hypothetical protein